MALLTSDPFASTLLLLALLWLVAKLGGEVSSRLHLPAVAGELGMGIVLATLHQRFPHLPDISRSPEAAVLANLGVVVLMFVVGLESTVPQMVKVGFASLRVALLGVLLPMGFCLLGTRMVLPAAGAWSSNLFIAACLSATSISISVQVLRERKAEGSREGRVIVGAAVIDDVLGLLVLVAVSALVTAAGRGSSLPWGELGYEMLLALGFLALALSLGRMMTSVLFRIASRLRGEQLLLPIALAFAFLLAYLGNRAGLAPIVGAYSAGLILEPAHIRLLEEREAHGLKDLLRPLVVILAPLFFIQMGSNVDPEALVSPSSLRLMLVLTVLGILGKYLAGFSAGKGLRASVVGWGMVPRGEVGLIFVAVGATLTTPEGPLLPQEVRAGVIGALLLTTLAGPVGLSRVLPLAGAGLGGRGRAQPGLKPPDCPNSPGEGNTQKNSGPPGNPGTPSADGSH